MFGDCVLATSYATPLPSLFFPANEKNLKKMEEHEKVGELSPLSTGATRRKQNVLSESSAALTEFFWPKSAAELW